MARTIKQEIKFLEKKMDVNPKSTLFARLADAYLKNEQVDKAIDICEKGLRFHPFYTTGHYLMAKCYLASGDYDHAKAELDRTLKFDPSSLVATKLLGDMFKITRNQSGFQSSYKRLWEIDPLNQSVSRLVDEMGLKTEQPSGVDVSGVEIMVPRQDDNGELIHPPTPPSVRSVDSTLDVSTATEGDTPRTGVDHLIDDAFSFSSLPAVDEEPTSGISIKETPVRTFAGPPGGTHEVDDVINRVKQESSPGETHDLSEPKDEGTFSSILADIFGTSPATPAMPITSEIEREPVVETVPDIKPQAPSEGILPSAPREGEKEISYDEFVALQVKEQTVPPIPQEPSRPRPEPAPVKDLIEPNPEPRGAPKTATISTAKGETKIVSATLGEIYISQGQFEAALQIFKALSAVDPENSKYQRKIKQLEDILVQEKSV